VDGWKFDGWTGDTLRGADEITMNGNKSITAVFSWIPVEEPEENTPPVAGDDSYSVRQDQILTVGAPGALRNDRDPDGDDIWAILLTGPSHGILDIDTREDQSFDGSFTYDPEDNFTGTDTFTYELFDEHEESDTATVTITVTRKPTDVDPVTRYTLTTSVEGEGTITPAPGRHTYDKGKVVKLTAEPAEGWEFTGWTGDELNGENEIKMDSSKSVKAVFTKKPTVIVPEEETPVGPAEPAPEEKPVEPEPIVPPVVPVLPWTGGIPAAMFYGAGALLAASGFALKKRK
jgi:hypothetical protein